VTLALASMLVSALLVGLLIGCVGIGGVLLPPALVYLGGLDFHLATATSVWAFLFCGVAGTLSSLSRIERNEAEPRPSILRKLASALGVEPRELIKRSNDA
jgi:uncharacterized membrane protein YfcA